jgi:hypothetical protein
MLGRASTQIRLEASGGVKFKSSKALTAELTEIAKILFLERNK